MLGNVVREPTAYQQYMMVNIMSQTGHFLENNKYKNKMQYVTQVSDVNIILD